MLSEDQKYWKGYWKQGSTRGDMSVEMTFGADGSIHGFGFDILGTFKIEGTHSNYEKFTFTKTMITPEEWTIEYEGHFVRKDLIQGKYRAGVSTGPFEFRLVENDAEVAEISKALSIQKENISKSKNVNSHG